MRNYNYWQQKVEMPDSRWKVKFVPLTSSSINEGIPSVHKIEINGKLTGMIFHDMEGWKVQENKIGLSVEEREILGNVILWHYRTG